MDIVIPGDVPKNKHYTFRKNYQTITKGTDNVAIFAGDQHIEHLNDDFFNISRPFHNRLDHTHPEHLFKIAEKNHLGAFATQFGLVARYGPKYKKVPYIIKVNSKTNLVPTDQKDPVSEALVTIEDIMNLKKNAGLNIIGIGYTIYLGSEYESVMLKQASKLIIEAHKQGLLALLWMYPRGNAVDNEKDIHLIAGAAGVASCLGADIVKVNYPKSGTKAAERFREVVFAAGNTKVICAGGSKKNLKKFLKDLHDQIHVSGAAGSATGRNIHQLDLPDAIAMTKAIASVTYRDAEPDKALKLL